MCHVLDGDVAITVDVGSIGIDAGITTQQVINQGGHVLDGHLVVAVNIANNDLGLLGEDDGVIIWAGEVYLWTTAVVVKIDKVFPAVDDVVQVKLDGSGCSGSQWQGLVDGLYSRTHVAIDVLVHLDGDVLVVGSWTVVGNGEHYAELIVVNDIVSSIQHLKRSREVGGRHRVDGDRASGNGVATVIIEREGKGIGSRSIGHKSEGDVAGLARH